MSADTSAPRSRRALLAGALGGVAALAANAIGRPLEVRAADNGNFVLGNTNNATQLTYLLNNTDSDTVLGIQSTTGGLAISGVSNTNDGVVGTSQGAGNGVFGTSSTGVGVKGVGAFGVHGSNSANGVGVVGLGAGGTGVWGQSASGIGTYGQSDSGTAVSAWATADGTALKAVRTAPNGSGWALDVMGRMKLSRSTSTSVAVGSATKVVSLSYDITDTTNIYCTLDTNQAGLYLRNIQRDHANNKITFRLSAAVASGKYARINYLVVN
jgi:hypothetical protein